MKKKRYKMGANKKEKTLFILFLVILFIIVILNFGNKPSYYEYWRTNISESSETA